MYATATSRRGAQPLARIAAWAAAAALLAGCARPLETDYSGLNLVEVSGTVTLDGEPLPGAMVLFESEDQTYSYGHTDEAGRYELMFNSEQPGVTPGRKIVRITLGSVGEEADSSEDREDPVASSGRSAPTVRIPDRFNRNSELTAEVSPDRREFHFHLKSE